MTAGPAAAQFDCVGAQTATPATVTPTSLLPGETLTISGVGFLASTPLGIGLFNPPVVLGTVASNGLGNYTATVTLPLNTPPGQNEITVFGEGSNNTCNQSLGLFTVRALPLPVPPVTSAPVFVSPIVTGTGGVITITGNTLGTVPPPSWCSSPWPAPARRRRFSWPPACWPCSSACTWCGSPAAGPSPDRAGVPARSGAAGRSRRRRGGGDAGGGSTVARPRWCRPRRRRAGR